MVWAVKKLHSLAFKTGALSNKNVARTGASDGAITMVMAQDLSCQSGFGNVSARLPSSSTNSFKDVRCNWGGTLVSRDCLHKFVNPTFRLTTARRCRSTSFVSDQLPAEHRAFRNPATLGFRLFMVSSNTAHQNDPHSAQSMVLACFRLVRLIQHALRPASYACPEPAQPYFRRFLRFGGAP
jgi:hypothetical protein